MPTAAAKKATGGAASKLAAIQAEIGVVEKKGKVAFGKTSYTHVQLPEVIEALKPLMKKHKVAFVVTIDSLSKDGNHTTIWLEGKFIDTELPHDDPAATIVTRMPAEAVSRGDKAIPAATTMGQRYMLVALFQIPLRDPDTAIPNPEISTAGGKPKPPPKLTSRDRELLMVADTKGAARVEEGGLTQARYDALRETAVAEGKIKEFVDWMNS